MSRLFKKITVTEKEECGCCRHKEVKTYETRYINYWLNRYLTEYLITTAMTFLLTLGVLSIVLMDFMVPYILLVFGIPIIVTNSVLTIVLYRESERRDGRFKIEVTRV